MPDLPTGTVTFLFTDIEGSTALWELHRDTMRLALVRHDALVEQIVVEYNGHVVRPRGEGDSRFAVFARATDAVAAAAELQQALHAEPWPTPTPLRVRMALHTGEADLRESDYYGSAVNRCARLRAVAHGGQTLVSLATEQLVRGQLADGIALRDLGEHRLRDLRHHERIYQLIIDGQPADFPPLTTLDARPNNLPVQLTSFIGREQEVEVLCARLLDPQVRLLTLTAAGGSGKTRLALQVAAELLDDFPDGVWLVELAPMHDPALVGSAIAAALGVKESGAQPVVESLKLNLRDKRLLLVLDNFEQVLVAGLLVTELLQAAPAIKALVTSRAPLHLRGEHEVLVQPLGLPASGHVLDCVTLSQYAAVELFIQRARAVKPDFAVTNATAPAVAEICVRLDGLPLAIELAAGRSKMLVPQALLSRLDNRLKLLTGGARDLPMRQQTLRGTIDWSFSLLDANEQRLFTRLGVFAGGWTVEAAEAVCNASGDLGLDLLDGLQSLLDKSLLRSSEGAAGEPRFTMLETIHEYALEQLAASGEDEAYQRRHAQFFLALVETADEKLEHEVEWLDRLEQEHNNLRAALGWAVEREEADICLQLCIALKIFWALRGYYTEGQHWLHVALALPGTVPARVRAFALANAGALAVDQGNPGVAIPLLEEALTLIRARGHQADIADTRAILANALLFAGDYRQAVPIFEECLAWARSTAQVWLIAFSLEHLGQAAYEQEDFEQAKPLHEESLRLYRAMGNKHSGAWVLSQASLVALYEHNYAQAHSLAEESLGIFRELGVKGGIAWVVGTLAWVALEQGDIDGAVPLFKQSLVMFREMGDLLNIAFRLDALAAASVKDHKEPAQAARRAARLFGAAAALREAQGLRLPPADEALYQPYLAAGRAELDERAWVAAQAEGQAMTLEQAIAYALSEVPDA